MDRNSSHFYKLRYTGQLYKMSARRKALQNRAQQTGHVESECKNRYLTEDGILTSGGVPPNETPEDYVDSTDDAPDLASGGVPPNETPEDYIDSTDDASDLDEENEWPFQEDSFEDDAEEIISSGGVSQFKNMILKDALQYWALTTHQPRSSVNMILEIFHECTIYKNLPKDARTILQTPRTTMNITDIDGGRYFYNGVKHCLINSLEHVQVPDIISVNVSIDGLPLFKGSPSSFWPILINVQEIPILSPMIVAMFHGITKPPQLEQYLGPFVEEMNEVRNNGIQIKNRVIRVRLRAFISDSPARSYIKGVMSYNAKHGCLKCCTVGEYSYLSRTIFFWDSNAPERTDELFRRMAYPQHYRIYTPLLDLQYLNIIEDIVVADRLHLIDLGVMRRLLRAWVKGVFGTEWKLTSGQCSRISKELENMQLPSEIHRCMRSLEHLKYWKGTEYSGFLHYASIVVLRDHLKKSAYDHFLLLFCAVTILSSRVYEEYWSYADQLLYKFVTQFQSTYGIDYVASNIHNLLHVYNDVRKFGPLYSISSYPFENEMQHIKQLQRSGYKSLEQVAKRLFEFENAHIMRLRTESNSEPYLQQTKTEVRVIFTDFMLRKGNRDGWFLTKNLEVVKYITASGTGSSIKIKGKLLRETKNYFDNEFPSTGINICTANLRTLDLADKEYYPNEIKCKYVALSLQE